MLVVGSSLSSLLCLFPRLSLKSGTKLRGLTGSKRQVRMHSSESEAQSLPDALNMPFTIEKKRELSIAFRAS